MFPCATKQLLGLECPACGAQRAFLALLNGQFIDSFLIYPALLPGLITFFFVKRPKIFLALLLIDVGLIILGYFTRNFLF